MAKKYKLVRLEDADKARGYIDSFIQQLRSVDWLEMYVLGLDPVLEIYQSVEKSDECYSAMTADGKPIVLFGVRKLDNSQALIWCLGTNRLKEYWMPFARRSKRILREWNREYGTLINKVADFNKDAMQWLRWTGADFTEARKQKFNGYDFWEFRIEEAK